MRASLVNFGHQSGKYPFSGVPCLRFSPIVS
jgi:hypothetical protein